MAMHKNIGLPLQNLQAAIVQYIEQLYQQIVQQKLHHPLVLVMLTALALGLTFITVKINLVLGIVAIGAIAALPIVYAIVQYPKFGIVTMLVAAYLIMWVIRFGVNFPLGTVMDGLEALLILGFLIKMKKEKDWSMFKNPVSYMILVWITYIFIEVLNPTAASKMAWVFTVRSVALVMLMYFIFMYHIRTEAFIKLIIKIWLGLAAFAALYAIKQEYIGFFGFEYKELADPQKTLLYFIDGRWRKFSIFSDPVAFAYNMVSSSLLCIALIWGPTNKKQKIILTSLCGLFLFAMLFSGTRGAYVLVPVALAFFALLNFNIKMVFAGIIGAIGFVALIFIPTENPNIKRFQTAFTPSEDASFNVRKINQKKIQPFIQSHALGGGLGATGVWGQRFSPDSFLASFPPDSGYVRVAVELGWLGLLIFCVLMFTILRAGILNFFAIQNPRYKTYCLAMLLIAFALNIGNYPQEALVQFPTNIYFYLVVALINITYRLDKQEQQQLSSKNKLTHALTT
jgi:putative inorganic carbon (hco3(-)) transporter